MNCKIAVTTSEEGTIFETYVSPFFPRIPMAGEVISISAKWYEVFQVVFQVSVVGPACHVVCLMVKPCGRML